jgi:ribonuclease R
VKAILRGQKPDTSNEAVEALRASATDSSVRERAAMEVEREVVDLYRALFMRERVGESFEGRVSAVTSGGLYITLDDPFVDVLVRYEALGPDRYEVSENELSAVGQRSGDTVSLGDRVEVEIEDVAILRRTVYARRMVPSEVLERIGAEQESTSLDAPPRRGRLRAPAPEGEGPASIWGREHAPRRAPGLQSPGGRLGERAAPGGDSPRGRAAKSFKESRAAEGGGEGRRGKSGPSAGRGKSAGGPAASGARKGKAKTAPAATAFGRGKAKAGGKSGGKAGGKKGGKKGR